MSLSDAKKARAEIAFKRKEAQARDGRYRLGRIRSQVARRRQKHGAPTSPSPGKTIR